MKKSTFKLFAYSIIVTASAFIADFAWQLRSRFVHTMRFVPLTESEKTAIGAIGDGWTKLVRLDEPVYDVWFYVCLAAFAVFVAIAIMTVVAYVRDEWVKSKEFNYNLDKAKI